MGWNGIKNVSKETGMLEKLSHWVREDWNEKKRCIKPGGFLLYRQSRVGLVGQQNNDNKIPMFQGQYILK